MEKGKRDRSICYYHRGNGLFHPITWILSTDTEGRILDIAVMIYRESRGREVGRKDFKQFEGKSIKDSSRLIKTLLGLRALPYLASGLQGVKDADLY